MLPTRCHPVKFDCCGLTIHLVQRGHDAGKLVWFGVPCACGRTYTFESDRDRSNDPLCADVHPELVRMHCWAVQSQVDRVRMEIAHSNWHQDVVPKNWDGGSFKNSEVRFNRHPVVKVATEQSPGGPSWKIIGNHDD